MPKGFFPLALSLIFSENSFYLKQDFLYSLFLRRHIIIATDSVITFIVRAYGRAWVKLKAFLPCFAIRTKDFSFLHFYLHLSAPPMRSGALFAASVHSRILCDIFGEKVCTNKFSRRLSRSYTQMSQYAKC